MRTVGVTSDVAFCTSARILASEGKHVPAMTTPIRTNVRDGFEAVRNSVVDLRPIIVL